MAVGIKRQIFSPFQPTYSIGLLMSENFSLKLNPLVFHGAQFKFLIDFNNSFLMWNKIGVIQSGICSVIEKPPLLASLQPINSIRLVCEIISALKEVLTCIHRGLK